MSIEKHVVSLELAKQLKEAGYPQDTLFSWFNGNYTGNEDLDSWSVNESNSSHGGLKKVYAAPLASELGEQLPETIEYRGDVLILGLGKRRAQYLLPKARDVLSQYGQSEADARAQMWLYLKKENLL